MRNLGFGVVFLCLAGVAQAGQPPAGSSPMPLPTAKLPLAVRASLRLGLVTRQEHTTRGPEGTRTTTDLRWRTGRRAQMVRLETPEKITVDVQSWRWDGTRLGRGEHFSTPTARSFDNTWFRRDGTARVVQKIGAIRWFDRWGEPRRLVTRWQVMKLRPDGTVKSRFGFRSALGLKTYFRLFREGPIVSFNKGFGSP